MTKKIVLLTTTIVLACSSGWAQEKSDKLDREVTVVSDKVTKIRQADLIEKAYKFTKPLVRKTTITANQSTNDFTPPATAPSVSLVSNQASTTPPPRQAAYIRLGGGFVPNAEFSSGGNFYWKGKNALTYQLKHRSLMSNSTLLNQAGLVNRTYYDHISEGQIEYTHRLSSGVLKVGINADVHALDYYGIPEESTAIYIPNKPYTSGLDRLVHAEEIYAKLLGIDLGYLNMSLITSMSNYGSSSKQAPNGLVGESYNGSQQSASAMMILGGAISPDWSWHVLGAYSTMFNQASSAMQPVLDMKGAPSPKRTHNGNIAPQVRFKRQLSSSSSIDIDAGFGVGMAFLPNGKVLAGIRPEVTAIYTFANDYQWYVRSWGGITDNNIYMIQQEMPFLQPNQTALIHITDYNMRTGFKGKLTDHLGWELFGGWQRLTNMHYFSYHVNSQVPMNQTTTPVAPYYSLDYGVLNQYFFQTNLESAITRGVKLHASLGYNINKRSENMLGCNAPEWHFYADAQFALDKSLTLSLMGYGELNYQYWNTVSQSIMGYNKIGASAELQYRLKDFISLYGRYSFEPLYIRGYERSNPHITTVGAQFNF